MSFVVDTNIFLTLYEIGQLPALFQLNEILVPKTVKNEVKTVDLTAEARGRRNFKIIDVSDGETEHFVGELAKNLLPKPYKFLLELKEQANKIPLPDGWRLLVDVIIRNPAIAFSNVFTNLNSDNIIVQKDENTKVLSQADVHVCALAIKNKRRYILTMDASIWAALYEVDPSTKDRVRPIFSCLRLLLKDKPKTFIDALILVVSNQRYKFARNLLDSKASQICLQDLIRCIEDVLQRYVSDLITTKAWASEKDHIVELMDLNERIRDVVRKNVHHNGELVFTEDQFIKELNGIQASLVSAGVTS
jgi:hypothetical protein